MSDINVGAMAEAINDKADRDLNNVTSGIDYVIESQLPTAANNYTWYRKYKSGWVEQGCLSIKDGTTFNFPIEMASTNYSVVALTKVGTGEVKAASTREDLKTTTSCMMYYSSSAYYGYVEVRGMAA